MDRETRQALLQIAAARAGLESARKGKRCPDGTAREGTARTAARLTERRERREQEHRLAWSDLLLEQLGRTLAQAPESPALEAEVTAMAALATAWLESLTARRIAREQRRGPPPPGTVLHVRIPPRSLVYRAEVIADGQVKIPVLSRVLPLSAVTVQRIEFDEPAAAPSGDPLRTVINEQLALLHREES